MNIEYQITALTTSDVIITKIISIVLNDKKIILQEITTRYTNSELERNMLENILSQNQLDAIYTLWGDTPTVILPEVYYGPQSKNNE